MTHLEELISLDPSGKQPAPRIEMPTPHRVAVLILMKEYLREKKMQSESGLFFSPQTRRNFCVLLLKLIQYPDLAYNDLHNMLTGSQYKIDVIHLEGFEKAMSDMFAVGIEALFDFGELQNIEKMLCEQWGVSQFSIMGVYIRRVGVVLERLSFTEMTTLYKNICQYYERGVRALAIGPRKVIAGGVLHRADERTSDAKPSVSDNGGGGGGDEDESTAKELSGRSMDTTQTSNKAQLTAATTISVNNAALHDTNIILDRNPLCKWSPKQAKLFVSQQSELLESNELRALPPAELQKRLNEIIQDNPLISSPYFLSYMNQLRVRDYFTAMDALHRAFDRSPVRMMSQEKGFQYFCMNLAVLHATFGHRNEAIAALNESIMLAQENSDKRCLNMANTWFCMLQQEDPHAASTAGIRGPKGETNAKESTPLLASTALALQYSVKMSASTGFQPLSLFDMLHRSDELCGSKNNQLEHVTDSLAMRSAVWSVYGRHEMASLYSQMLLNMKKRLNYGDVSNSEGVASVLASFTMWLYLQGEKHLAQVLLNHARISFPRHPNSESWMVTHCHIVIHDGIYRCRWHDALKACDQLYLYDENDGILQRAAVYVARRYFYEARELLQQLQAQENLPLLMQLRVLMLLAYCSMADKRFSSEAVQLLLSAAERTKAAQMDFEHASVNTALAQLLLTLDMPQKAFEAVKDSMVVLHVSGALYDRAKADFVFVRCLLATITDMTIQRVQLQQSLSILERAVSSFKKLEAHAKVLDIYVYIAKCFDAQGERELRNKYAFEFRRYHAEHPIAREYLGSGF